MNLTKQSGTSSSIVVSQEKIVVHDDEPNVLDYFKQLYKVFTDEIYRFYDVPNHLYNITTIIFSFVYLFSIVQLEYMEIIYMLAITCWLDAFNDILVCFIISKTNCNIFKPCIVISIIVMIISYQCIYNKIETYNYITKLLYYFSMLILCGLAMSTYSINVGFFCLGNMKIPSENIHKIIKKSTMGGLGMLFGCFTFWCFTSDSDFQNNSTLHINNTNMNTEKTHYFTAAGVCNIVVFLIGIAIVILQKNESISNDDFRIDFSLIYKIIKYPTFINLQIGHLFSTISFLVILINLFIYMKYMINLNDIAIHGILYTFIILILSIYISNILMMVFNKHYIYVTGIVIFIPIILSIFLPNEFNIFILYFILSFMGYPIMTWIVMPWCMLLELVEEFQVTTHIFHFNFFYIITIFTQKFAAGISFLITGIALKYSEFDPNKLNQTETVTTTYRIYICTISICCLIVLFSLLLNYPINREKHRETHIKLKEIQLE